MKFLLGKLDRLVVFMYNGGEKRRRKSSRSSATQRGDVFSEISIEGGEIIENRRKVHQQKGNALYGTAALLHRICGNKEIEDAFDEEAYKKELYELLIECGYTTREDLYPEEYVEEYVPSRRSRETK